MASGLGLLGKLFSGVGFVVLPFLVLAARDAMSGIASKRRRARPASALSRLVPLPLPEGTYPVHVSVRFRGAPTGTDRACAAFVDGWLHVEGPGPASTSAGAMDGVPGGAAPCGSTSRTEGASLCAGVADATLGSHDEAFRRAAREWLARAERPEGESLLPPLATRPAVRTARARSVVLGLLAALGGVVSGGLLAAGGLAQASLLGLAIVGFAAAFRGTLVRLRQDEADLRAKALEAPDRSPDSGRVEIR